MSVVEWFDPTFPGWPADLAVGRGAYLCFDCDSNGKGPGSHAHEVCAVDHDELRHAGEPPRAYAERLAREKALLARQSHPQVADRILLAADTVVALGDEIYTKPGDEADCARMLAALAKGFADLARTRATADISAARRPPPKATPAAAPPASLDRLTGGE